MPNRYYEEPILQNQQGDIANIAITDDPLENSMLANIDKNSDLFWSHKIEYV